MRLVYFLYFLNFLSTSSCQTLNEDLDGQALSEQDNREQIKNTQIALIQSKIDRGEPDSALNIMEHELMSKVKLKDWDTSFLNLAGIAHLSLRNNIKALEYFEMAYEKSKSTPSLLNMSSVYLELKEPKKARKYLEMALKDEEYTYKERILHNLGFSYELEKRFGDAKKFYKKALDINSTFYQSNLRLGIMCFRSRELEKADTYFKKAHELCKTCFEPVKYLATRANIKDKIRAKKIMERYLSLKELMPKDRALATELLKKF